MLTHHENDWTPRFRHIAAILAELPVKTAYVDGEIAVLTAEGVSDFAALQEALGRHGGSREMAYIAYRTRPRWGTAKTWSRYRLPDRGPLAKSQAA